MTTDLYEQLSKEVVSSTEEIFSTMIPIDIKVGDSFLQEESKITTDVIAFVSFTGEHSGIIGLFCVKDIALKITSGMLGVEATELDHDTKDAIGEVANMIAGSLKNKVNELLGTMHLSVPIVVGGSGLSLCSSGGETENVSINPSITCDTQSAWHMTSFSSNGHVFNVGLIVKKND